MNELFFLPTDITEMSVAQLATLTSQQKAQVSHHLDQIADWLKNSRAKFEASLEHAYGERIRHARTDAGRDFGVVHIADGDVRVSVDQSKRVSWDQAQLNTIANPIAAAGERVEEFIGVSYSISESRFQWRRDSHQLVSGISGAVHPPRCRGWLSSSRLIAWLRFSLLLDQNSPRLIGRETIQRLMRSLLVIDMVQHVQRGL